MASQLDQAKDIVLGLISTSAVLITFQLGLSDYFKANYVQRHPSLLVSLYASPFLFLVSAVVGGIALFLILEQKPDSRKPNPKHRITMIVMIQLALFILGMLGTVIGIFPS